MDWLLAGGDFELLLSALPAVVAGFGRCSAKCCRGGWGERCGPVLLWCWYAQSKLEFIVVGGAS